MVGFLIRRLASMVLVLFAVSVITFAIFELIPNGDPASRMAGRQASGAEIKAIRAEWNLDEPVYSQYATAMRQLLTGSATSYSTRTNVVEEIWSRLPRTLSLAIGAAILWMSFGVGLGLLAALRAGQASDRLLTMFALIGVSLPVFWIGALANHYLGFQLDNALGFELFTNGGYVAFTDDPLAWMHHLILPWIVLSLGFVGLYLRVVRSAVLETMGQDYVRTARAKGLSERQVLLRHVLRSAMIPAVTLWGLDFAVVAGGGAILVETVFDLQGVGQYAAEGVAQLDLPPVMAVTLFGAFFVVICNAVVDVAQALLDPRVRLTRRTAT
jgi:peptide/nickel transport system permease protein